MRIIALSTLRTFWTRHPHAEQPLRAWYAEASKAEWTGPADIKARYASASFIGNERVVFNIGGNNYRLVILIRYPMKLIYIRFIGTHAEYDKIDVSTV